MYCSPLLCPEPLYLAYHWIILEPIFTQFPTVISYERPYIYCNRFIYSSGHMKWCPVLKSSNQFFYWWLFCKRYAYTVISVSRHYYATRILLFCLCIFGPNKAFWSWSWKSSGVPLWRHAMDTLPALLVFCVWGHAGLRRIPIKKASNVFFYFLCCYFDNLLKFIRVAADLGLYIVHMTWL